MVIVQFPLRSPDDFERLVQIEEGLIQTFAQRNPFGEVDGHDIGEDRFNIFIKPTDTWGPVIERVEALLKYRGVLKDALIVKRLKSEKYVVVWPKDYGGGFEL